MSLTFSLFEEKSRLAAPLNHFAHIPDPRNPWRAAHPLCEAPLLIVCGTMADCDDYDGLAAWGGASCAPAPLSAYDHGVPGERWLTLLMNRINPALFSAAFSAWARQTWPDRPNLVAIDGENIAPQP